MKKVSYMPTILLVVVLIAACSSMDNINPFGGSSKPIITVDCDAEALPATGDVMAINEAVLFGHDESTLDDAAIAIIDKVAGLMKTADVDLILSVDGYASIVGSNSYNKFLSTQRAENVSEALVERGVAKDRIKVIGSGETDKFGAESQNRRVVILGVK